MYATQILAAARALPKPAPLATPSGAAFTLVRQILKERPKHFHEIMQDGVAAVDLPAGEQAAEQAGPSTPVKGKGKKTAPVVNDGKPGRKDGLEVPSGHPFISGTFLKKRILPILESQRLVKREWHFAQPGTTLARHGTRKHSMFALVEDGKAAERWEKVSAEDVGPYALAELGLQVKAEERAAAQAAKEARHDAGEPRTERDIWAWSDRPKGRTTNLERLHLNVRRKRARDGKEERAAQLEAEREEARLAAAEAVSK